MRLGYFADGPWAHLALECIAADDRCSIAFIVPRFDTQDPVLREWAQRLQVPFLPLADVNSPQSLQQLAEFRADLFVSMSFNQILKRDILALPPQGIINCHAGALPAYRGRNVLNWALINDEPSFGVTIHYVDEGIDTGDIILQRQEPITDQDTYASLLSRATVACAELLHEALIQIATGTASRTPQSHIAPVGLYVGRRRAGDEWIDWNWPSRRIFNFVRAISAPGPRAQSVMDGHTLFIERAALIPGAPNYIGTPGEIVGVGARTIVVKTGDSTIALDRPEGAPIRLHIGKRFVSKQDVAAEQLKLKVADLQAQIRRLEQQH